LSKSHQQKLFDEPLEDPAVPAWELAAQKDRLTAQVVFNRPLDTAFHYLVPDALRGMLQPGQRVRVPFGKSNRGTIGYCVGVGQPPETAYKLKSIDAVLDHEPLLTPQMLELTQWIGKRYLCSWGQVLEAVVPAGVKKKAGTRMVKFFQIDAQATERLKDLKLSSKQAAVINVLKSAGKPLNAQELTTAADCGTSPIETLRKKGLIEVFQKRMNSQETETETVEQDEDLILNPDQERVLSTILATLRAGKHETQLLHGVTGSGKTEVYIQAIREVVSYGRQAIVLVPEISLTPQTIRRFNSRFDSVAVLHSHLSDAERHWHWQQIRSGAVQVVVGARSAVFAPTPHLGLIVIDEEHENTFKQETTPRYHAREVARERARIENIPLILGSATPTLESWNRVIEKKDTLISLPNRVAKRPMPPVVIVDIRNDPASQKGQAVGRVLFTGIRSALQDDGQIILFLNLRGHSPTLWCRACGESIRCPHCDLTLTWHKDKNIALCHLCDFECPPLTHCPKCGHAGVRYLGIGTQRLEQEVRAKFPEAKIIRMDSDSMRKPGSHNRALEAFRHGEVQILLGTQMIAKGLDFPNVTLVGVINADTMLHQPDFRASERTFQLISQVAGRTGRSDRGGRVLVQTSCPTEPAILRAAEHDYLGFVQDELPHRREMQTPPFYHFARIIFRGENEQTVAAEAKRVANVLNEQREALNLPVNVLGPAICPVTKLKKNFRYHLQLGSPEIRFIHKLWTSIGEYLPKSRDVEFTIDIDPVNMR